LKPDDKRDNTPKPDPALKGYVSAKEFADLHGVHYGLLLEDIRKGLYDSVITRKQDRFIYIKEDAECLTFNFRNEIKGYLSLREYAEDRQVDYVKLKNDVVRGVYSTAKKVSNHWYIKETEECKTVDAPKDRIHLSEYARRHHISYSIVLADVKKGIYTTAKKVGHYWYIDGDEPLKSENKRKKKKTNKFISISEYARRNSIAYSKMIYDVKRGAYQTTEERESHWFINPDEPCKSNVRKKKHI